MNDARIITSRPSTARRRTARTIRGAAEAIRFAAALAGIAVALAYIDTGNGPTIGGPRWVMAVLMLAALGVDRLGLLLRDAGDYVERSH